MQWCIDHCMLGLGQVAYIIEMVKLPLFKILHLVDIQDEGI